MKKYLRFAYAYFRYDKAQTFALVLGVALFAALLTGMGGLLESGRQATLTNARMEYGDWHYAVRADQAWTKAFEQHPKAAGYELESAGRITIRKVLEQPFRMRIVFADEVYRRMMGIELLQGHYPEQKNELAMDARTLHSMGVDARIGTTVDLDGEKFILCGIVSEMPKMLLETDAADVFVGQTPDDGASASYYYLKFDEGRSVYRQIHAFAQNFGVDMEGSVYNKGISAFVEAQPPEQVLAIIKTGMTQPGTGLPYIWGMLNEGRGLAKTAVLAAIAVFGAFIIYSLFQISVVRRMSQYSMLQAVGITDRSTFWMLLTELLFICLAGYPFGCFVGGLLADKIYQRAGRIFIIQEQMVHTGVTNAGLDSPALSLKATGSYVVSWRTVAYGAVFLFTVILLISVRLMRKMRRLTIRQMMVRDTKKRMDRRIYSLRRGNLTSLLTRRFMMDRWGTFAGILLSLSIGSVIFLSAFYVTENTKIHHALTYKADDGLASDIQVYTQSERLADVIPQDVAARIAQLSGVGDAHPVRYMLGELSLPDGRLVWKEFFADIADDPYNPPDPVIQEKYHGIAVQTGADAYKLKVNIYGYDDAMLQELDSYLLEGAIDPEEMRRDGTVIFKTIMDGQGNYDGIRMHPGDSLQLKAPCGVDVSELPQEALRFEGEDGWYRTIDLNVAAVVSRPLAKVESFIGDSGTSEVDLIMTNEQMEQNFGVTGYRTISISLDRAASGQDTIAAAVSAAVGKLTHSLNGCVVKDYSQQIAAQDRYLTQKMLFYYGIAAVLLAISLLHIGNSMRYLVLARRRELGILRAMGITDTGFFRLRAKTGFLYGVYSALAVMGIYLIVQKVLYYFMVHVYRYLHPRSFISWQALAGAAAVNIFICMGVVMLSGRMIVREQIVEQLRE